jgi:hypothetical protein
MTRQEVIMKAIEGRISWIQAADILRLAARHVRRLRERFEHLGSRGLLDGRAGCEREKKIREEVLREICRLKREIYPDYSVRHFHEQLVGKHRIDLSYTWTKNVLQAAGVVPREGGRGRYRRRRERRAMAGMLLHLDASTHAWLPELPSQDLVVMLDDADGRILFARFFEQEGTRSTLMALKHVLQRWGRFCELYTDRGSHFCTTTKSEAGPDAVQQGQVTRVLGRWGSATSWRGLRRPAGAANGPSGPSRGGCPRNCAWRGSGPTPQPTTTSRRPSSPTSTAASASQRRPLAMILEV